MGIKNLHSFLRSKCPEIYKTMHLSEYAYKKIAIDISLYMFKYKTIFGDKWLDAFLKLVACLRKNEIHCVFIYDNGAPPEKMSTAVVPIFKSKLLLALSIECFATACAIS